MRKTARSVIVLIIWVPLVLVPFEVFGQRTSASNIQVQSYGSKQSCAVTSLKGDGDSLQGSMDVLLIGTCISSPEIIHYLICLFAGNALNY